MASSRDTPAAGRRGADRPVLSNWQDAPCPACGATLRYHSDIGPGAGMSLLVLVRCDEGHFWQERLSLATLHSGVFVERRRDREQPDGAG